MTIQNWRYEGKRKLPKTLPISKTAAATQGKEAPSVILADDHAIVLEGMRLSLEAGGMKVLAVAQDASQALRILDESPPDVLLTDLHMPGMSGLELLRKLREKPRSFKVVILTGDPNAAAIEQARSLEADGFLSKDLGSDALVEAVGKIAAGERVFIPSATLPPPPENTGAVTPSGAQLSEQEIEVLRLLAQALDNKEIAAALVISENTVKSHVSSILNKLAVNNRTQAALWALRHQVNLPH